jgi:histidine ammonia-lyase
MDLKPTTGQRLLRFDGETLSVADLVAVARVPGTRVASSGEAMARVAHTRSLLCAAVDRYARAYAAGDALPHIYGVTTGIGEFKRAGIGPTDLREFQRNLILSHAVGVGDSSDEWDPANYLAADVVRASLAIRLNSFLKGHSGVRPALAELLGQLLDAGVVPLAPTRGSLGASGDLCPLAHMAMVILGRGTFYVVKSEEDVRRGMRGAALHRGDELPVVCPELAGALQALEEDGRPWPMLPLSYKEGLALMNGTTVSTAILAMAVHDSGSLAECADIAAAMSLEALLGQSAAFDPRIHDARGHAGQVAVAAHIRTLIAGSAWVDSGKDYVQDAYSLRCVPQVHGAARDVITNAQAVVEREINAATDNPLIFAVQDGLHHPVESIDVLSGGNFHGAPIGFAADFLAVAVSELASIAERRIQMLLDAHHSRGLPANLTKRCGLHSGLMITQYTAASLVTENKGICHPASVDSIPTSANTEDHNSMSMTAARKLRTVVSNVQTVVAIELLAAAQAVDLRAQGADRSGVIGGHRLEAIGVGTHAAHLFIRALCSPVVSDRPLGADIRVIRRGVEDGRVVDAVDAALRSRTHIASY